MKPRPAILRLWTLAFLALGSGFLLRNRLQPPTQRHDSNGAPQNLPGESATPASYAELVPSAKTPDAKACCDKPPTRAFLMRSAPTAGSQ